MPQSLAKNLIHLVFATKNRKSFITGSLRKELHGYMTRVLKNMGCPVLKINSVEDHVHILFIQSSKVALSKTVGELKSSSSKWINAKLGDSVHFAWQTGYGAFSVSESNADAVKKYILDQENHHSERSFKEEFRVLLKKHKIKYEECYVWD